MKETKIVCPKCGTEFEIPEHEYASAGIVIGKDSGLGTIVLKEADTPVTKAQKRLETLKKAGVDVSSLFAMQTGDIARLDNGVMSVVPDDDPIFQAIMDGGTIPDRHLFRRWVMAQMFHLLVGNFTDNLRAKGYDYQWRVIEDELRVQKKLFLNDKENFSERNAWFDKSVVVAMCSHYSKCLERHINYLKKKPKKCKGVPYIRIAGKNVFLSDIWSKVACPINRAVSDIEYAKTPADLYYAYLKFKRVYIKVKGMRMSASFIDAYKGVGAYYTMKNMILFHSCLFRTDSGKRRGCWMSKEASIQYLCNKAAEYSKSDEGWRLFGVMRKLIADNNIDIQKKMAEWRKK